MIGFSKRIASIGAFLLPLILYAAFVAAYFYLVLAHLGGLLKRVFESSKPLYALLALALISAQGFLLEVLTGMLLRVTRRNVK